MNSIKKDTVKLFSLGDLYVTDFLSEGAEPNKGKVELALVLDPKTGAVRLNSVVDPEVMYGEYWYRSGINSSMTQELYAIVKDCMKSIRVKPGDIWLDIACNDGTLFKAIPEGIIKIGIDPADDSFADESREVADLIIQDFFSADVYQNSKYGHQKAKIVTTVAMFYDLDDPLSFLRDINEIMDDEGLFVLQMSYTPLMLKQLAFDNICHEHVYYYTLTSIKNLLDLVDLRIVDCQINDVNGGSFRVYIRKNKATITNFRTAPYRDVAQYRIESLLIKEQADKVDTPAPYLDFFKKISELKQKTVQFIRNARADGKTIWGYGASTKGNTLLQWFGLDNSDIEAIAERNPDKYGRRTVGTNIPIRSEADMREANPDYLLILPWHFISEFSAREKKYLNSGGKFIVPCPYFDVIGGEK